MMVFGAQDALSRMLKSSPGTLFLRCGANIILLHTLTPVFGVFLLNLRAFWFSSTPNPALPLKTAAVFEMPLSSFEGEPTFTVTIPEVGDFKKQTRVRKITTTERSGHGGTIIGTVAIAALFLYAVTHNAGNSSTALPGSRPAFTPSSQPASLYSIVAGGSSPGAS
jgi:hypothetical protein